MRKLGELLEGIIDERSLAPLRDRLVSGVFDDSRCVRPEGIFVALRGAVADGRSYVRDALQRGAAIILGEALEPAERAVVLQVPDARTALAQLAQRWYGLDQPPQSRLKLVGVTGTNGKTTTAIMTRAILQADGGKCALFGTVYNDLCSRTITADMTTPGPLKLAAYLREALDAGARAAVMEVSSHALDQRRAAGLRFGAAGFTNLTGDHLDYHLTFENYRNAKKRLFDELEAGAVAVVNRDDPNHAALIGDCKARVVTFALNSPADISATITRDSSKGTLYRLRIEGRDLVVENAIVGRHNVYNAMTAAGLARAVGASFEAIAVGLASVRNIPGRLQRVPCVSGADVFVDYAHTDDALQNVLSVLRPLTRGRLIVVFGCGGDRDRSKRPRMAGVAAALADLVVVTSDNPRTEEPEAIIREIAAGFDADAATRVTYETDRRTAIRRALECAGEGDVVLIAGKGHEDYQIIGAQRLHFDDVEVAIQAAAEIAARGTCPA